MFILSDTPSIANQFLYEMRNVDIQSDSLRFRKNLERLGEILAYEISKSFTYLPTETTTPLAKTHVEIPQSQPVIFSVMRAALPFYQGFLNIYDKAESGFIGAFREENNSNDISINLGYHTSPNITGKTIIIADPMLATGKSLLSSLTIILKYGTPKHIHIAAAVAAPEGLAFVKENLKHPFSFWIGAVDQKLDHNFYIIPGLGDAGDLAFGSKL
jgi:uracil phosphoribosyltransferase